MWTQTKYGPIKTSTLDALNRYVQDGIPPGSFLQAVLCNNLMHAFNNADSENKATLGNIVAYVWNELPYNCWGSGATVEAWCMARTPIRADSEAPPFTPDPSPTEPPHDHKPETPTQH